MPFILPRHGDLYTASILTRCRALIAHGIWQGIEQDRLGQWLNNFPGAIHRYFAARVLDTLMYRSEPQTKSMLIHLLQRTVPDVLRDHRLAHQPVFAYDRLRTSNDPNIRLVPVASTQAATTTSGPLVGRLIKRQLRVRSQWIIRHQDITPSTPCIVFVDDFIGTGRQFLRFVRENELTDAIESNRCCYVALAAHRCGIQHIAEKFPNLPVSAVDLLEPSHSIFNPQDSGLLDDVNPIQDAIDFYHEILDRQHIRNARFRHGYGGLNLAYAFAHAVPNNSTPLLWWNQSPSWVPLLDR